jgi:hypothetical protein
MSALPKARRTVNRITRFATVGALALGGVAVSAGSASADPLLCRGAATEPVGVHLDSCIGGNASGLYAQISVSVDPGGTAAYPCAQLWRVNGDGTESFVHDYQCPGHWYYPGQGTVWTSAAYLPPSGSTYVVRVGYWATLDGQYGYYGDVESPTVYVG